MGAGESQGEQYFRTGIFPRPDITESLQRSDRQPMAKHTTVPNTRSKLKVSTQSRICFTDTVVMAPLPSNNPNLTPWGTQLTADNQGLIYPFFVIEFEGDGPTDGGSMWVATNQRRGGSASCVNIAQRLNHRQPRQCKSDAVRPINSAAFSIAMSGTEARLYISWEHHNDLDYYTATVESFLLQRPDHYLDSASTSGTSPTGEKARAAERDSEVLGHPFWKRAGRGLFRGSEGPPTTVCWFCRQQ